MKKSVTKTFSTADGVKKTSQSSRMQDIASEFGLDQTLRFVSRKDDIGNRVDEDVIAGLGKVLGIKCRGALQIFFKHCDNFLSKRGKQELSRCRSIGKLNLIVSDAYLSMTSAIRFVKERLCKSMDGVFIDSDGHVVVECNYFGKILLVALVRDMESGEVSILSVYKKGKSRNDLRSAIAANYARLV